MTKKTLSAIFCALGISFSAQAMINPVGQDINQNQQVVQTEAQVIKEISDDADFYTHTASDGEPCWQTLESIAGRANAYLDTHPIIIDLANEIIENDPVGYLARINSLAEMTDSQVEEFFRNEFIIGRMNILQNIRSSITDGLFRIRQPNVHTNSLLLYTASPLAGALLRFPEMHAVARPATFVFCVYLCGIRSQHYYDAFMPR